MNEWTVFGERLKAELARHRMSYRDLAGKADITVTTVCRYVNNNRIPRANEILKLAKVFGCSCDYLLGLSDGPYVTSAKRSEEILKPCPFCGESPQSGVELYDRECGRIRLAATVYCAKCNISRRKIFLATDINPVPFFDYEVAFDKVKKAWNQREGAQ